MYIERLHVRYLKLLEDFELSFTAPDGQPRMWTVVIGPNGTAKTSLLQAIALAAAGELQVNGLAKPVLGHLRDRRSGKATSTMVVDARFQTSGADQARVASEVRFRTGTRQLTAHASTVGGPPEAGDPLVQARSRTRAPGWFVAGYGVSRFLPDPTRAPKLENPAIERLEPLFHHTGGLTSLRFVDWFPKQRARAFVETLRDTLVAVDELVPALQGIELRGAGGVTRAGQLIERDRFQLRVGDATSKLPAVALSHGYQSTIAWLADFIGQMFLEHDGVLRAADMKGLVLVDELDLYLHPTWQAGLIPALRRTFPKVQFVVTTHSPVVLSGVQPHEIVRVAPDPHTGSIRRVAHDPDTGTLVPVGPDGPTDGAEPDPRMLTGSELYRNWFGIDRLVLNPHGAALRTWVRLAGDPYRSEAQESELAELTAKLDAAGVPRSFTPVPRADAP